MKFISHLLAGAAAAVTALAANVAGASQVTTEPNYRAGTPPQAAGVAGTVPVSAMAKRRIGALASGSTVAAADGFWSYVQNRGGSTTKSTKTHKKNNNH